MHLLNILLYAPILFVAGFTIYKIRCFIWGEVQDPVKVGECKTEAEAHYLTQKAIRQEYPETGDLVEIKNGYDRHGEYKTFTLSNGPVTDVWVNQQTK